MTDEEKKKLALDKKKKDLEDKKNGSADAPPPTKAQNLNNENMIPQSRLNEVIEERKKLAEKLEQIEIEQKAATEKRLVEQEEWQKLAESRAEELAKANSEANKVKGYEETLESLLASEVALLPKSVQGMVPEALSIQEKLAWIAKNKSLLVKPPAPDISADKDGNVIDGKDKNQEPLTEEELEYARKFGMTAKEYQKYKK